MQLELSEEELKLVKEALERDYNYRHNVSKCRNDLKVLKILERIK